MRKLIRNENNINNSSTNNIIDHDNSRNLGNSNRIDYDNYVDNESNKECNNTRELVNVNSNRNLDSSNNFIRIMTRGSNTNSYESSSNWREVYYFLPGVQKKKN